MHNSYNAIREALKKDGTAIRFIKEQTEEFQELALQSTPNAVEYIRNPSEKIQMEIMRRAVKNEYNKGMIYPGQEKLFKNLYPSAQIEALKEFGYIALKYMNPIDNETIKFAATNILHAYTYLPNMDENQYVHQLRLAPYFIKKIENQTEAMQIAAVSGDGTLLKEIKNPSDNVKLAAVKQCGKMLELIENPSADIIYEALKQDGRAIRYIENPTEEMKYIAINKTPEVIREIDSPTEVMKELAVEKKPDSIVYCKNPSEKLQLLAVDKNPENIKFINPPEALFESVALLVVKKNSPLIKYVRLQTEEVQKAAIKRSPYLIKYIPAPSKALMALAISLDPNCLNITYTYDHGEDIFGRGFNGHKEGTMAWNEKQKCWNVSWRQGGNSFAKCEWTVWGWELKFNK